MVRKLSELCEISGWFLCRIGCKLKERLFWDHSDWNVSFLFVFHAFGSSLLPQAHSGSRISHVAGIQIHQDIIDIATFISSLLLCAGRLRSCDKAELSSSCVCVHRPLQPVCQWSGGICCQGRYRSSSAGPGWRSPGIPEGVLQRGEQTLQKTAQH